MSTSKKRALLSFEKVSSFVTKYGYGLVTLYVENNECLFIELRTPRYQKTFIVGIPERYKLLISVENYRRVNIKNSGEPTTKKSLYLVDMKGPLLECDIFSVSSEEICTHKNNGEFACYKIIIDGEDLPAPAEIYAEEQDPVEKVFKETRKVLESFGGETDDLDKPKKKKHRDQDEIVIVERGDATEDQVIIEFEDDDGLPVEKASEPAKEKKKKKKKKSNDEEEENEQSDTNSDSSSDAPRDNSLPELEDEDIESGMIYVLVDIKDFFGKAAFLESELVSLYDSIDENEVELRRSRVDTINELSIRVKTLVEDKLKEIENEERKIRIQVSKLSTLLLATERVQLKTPIMDPRRAEIDKAHYSTRLMIHEMNVELLRLRDKINNILTSYLTSLEDVMLLV